MRSLRPCLLLSLFSLLLGEVVTWSVEERCESCMDISNAFGAGLRRTKAANFGGGNTEWEERKLGKFALSETRLVDVMERLCNEARHSKLCHSIVEEKEDFIETWWRAHVNAAMDGPSSEMVKVQEAEAAAESVLHHKLCISAMQVCCPASHFGDMCVACPSKCSDHGRCRGNGTRAGDGSCDCDRGYAGVHCQKCRKDHFRNEEAGRCQACDPACDGCTGTGPGKCKKCGVGYQLSVTGSECIDVNECSPDSQICRGPNRKCRNTIGSYICECEAGYRDEGGKCVKPPPSPPKRPPPKKKKKTDAGKDDKKKKAKRIWTKRFTREFFKFAGAILVLGLGSYLLKGRVVPVAVITVGCGVFLYWESVRLDNAFMRKKNL